MAPCSHVDLPSRLGRPEILVLVLTERLITTFKLTVDYLQRNGYHIFYLVSLLPSFSIDFEAEVCRRFRFKDIVIIIIAVATIIATKTYSTNS